MLKLQPNLKFIIQNSTLTFTEEEILIEVDAYPERFSGNVILRGVFQETVLPNIAFIGGGGELAYWLELKNVFETVKVPYPVLILRNSFLLIEPFQKEKINKLGPFLISEKGKNNQTTQYSTNKGLYCC